MGDDGNVTSLRGPPPMQNQENVPIYENVQLAPTPRMCAIPDAVSAEALASTASTSQVFLFNHLT